MVDDYRFEVFVDEATDGKQYVVKYYDFESVIGVGDTIEEAIEDGRGNLEFYIKYCEDKGILVPSPSKHMENDFSGKITLRLSKTLHKIANERAEQEGVSLNALLCEAISNYVYSNYTIENIVEKSAMYISNMVQSEIDSAYKYAIDQNVIDNSKKNDKYVI